MPNRGHLHKANKNIDREKLYEVENQFSNSIYLDNPNFNKVEQGSATEPPGTFIYTVLLLDGKFHYALLPTSYRNTDIFKNIQLIGLFGKIMPWKWKEVEKLWLKKMSKRIRVKLDSIDKIIEFLLDLENYSKRSYIYENSRSGPKEYSANWMVEKWWLTDEEKLLKSDKKTYENLLSSGRSDLSNCIYHLLWISGFRVNFTTWRMNQPGAKTDIFCYTNNSNDKGYSFSEDYFKVCTAQAAYVSKNTSPNEGIRMLNIDKENHKIYFGNEK